MKLCLLSALERWIQPCFLIHIRFQDGNSRVFRRKNEELSVNISPFQLYINRIIIDHSKTQWLDTTTVYYFSSYVGGIGLTQWLFWLTWATWRPSMQLHSVGNMAKARTSEVAFSSPVLSPYGRKPFGVLVWAMKHGSWSPKLRSKRCQSF